MPDSTKVVVINTTPLIALTAAIGNLDVLRTLYTRVVVPYEVAEEIRAGGRDAFGLDVFEQASWLEIKPNPVILQPYLRNSLDCGEASVIQTAIQKSVQLVLNDIIFHTFRQTNPHHRAKGEIGGLRKYGATSHEKPGTAPGYL